MWIPDYRSKSDPAEHEGVVDTDDCFIVFEDFILLK